MEGGKKNGRRKEALPRRKRWRKEIRIGRMEVAQRILHPSLSPTINYIYKRRRYSLYNCVTLPCARFNFFPLGHHPLLLSLSRPRERRITREFPPHPPFNAVRCFPRFLLKGMGAPEGGAS